MSPNSEAHCRQKKVRTPRRTEQKKCPTKTRARAIAEEMIEKAEAGDLSALREIMDCVEGKLG
jgi:hypothetical protein